MMNKEKESFQTTGLKMATEADVLDRIILPIIIVLNTILFVVMAFFNAAASTQIVKGLFKNNTGQVSSEAGVSITPAGWTFTTWGIIYAWQALWLTFNVVLIFIKLLRQKERKLERPLLCNGRNGLLCKARFPVQCNKK